MYLLIIKLIIKIRSFPIYIIFSNSRLLLLFICD